MPRRSGRYPSGQRGQTVNLLADAFGGSNPPLPTTSRDEEVCGNSSAVERQPSKLGVAGSNPVSRSMTTEAHVAQSAERVLGKDEVSGSIPDMGSRSGGRATAANDGRSSDHETCRGLRHAAIPASEVE
jgi:hypothetical protein